MRKSLALISMALLLGSCGEFNKAVKSTDLRYKYRMAEKYMAKPDYDRAMPLWEELLSLTRGDTLYESVSYNYAKGYFGMKDYLMASYYLNNFAKMFPHSEHAEECSFLSAYCHYKESPEFELDQRDTYTAIDKLELFMVRYPESGLTDSCLTLIGELRLKLEKKDYYAAQQYLRTRHYEAASRALDQFLRKWPNSKYREEALFSIFQADHDLAVNSVESKKQARKEAGIRSFNTFADAFPESAWMPQAKAMLRDLTSMQIIPQGTDTP